VLLASGWGGNDILVYDRPFNSTNFFFFLSLCVCGGDAAILGGAIYPPGNQLKTIFSDHQNRKEIKKIIPTCAQRYLKNEFSVV
jgi:hypothetical protein